MDGLQSYSKRNALPRNYEEEVKRGRQVLRRVVPAPLLALEGLLLQLSLPPIQSDENSRLR